MKQTDSGNPSYGGYEYQILVTIWSALELMLAKQTTEEIFIEPPSHEDIEADLNVDANNASSSLNISSGQIELMIQVKSRSTGPWTSSDISKVLKGSPKTTGDTRGPERRERPLEILRSNPNKHYIFVSNAALAEGLMPHHVDTLLDWPDIQELPPRCRVGFSADEQGGIAPRIALCDSISNEILSSRIESLLSIQGHVPVQKHANCFAIFKEQVRIRLQGYKGGRWSKEELLEVLRREGGSIQPNHIMSLYVPPSSYPKAVQALHDRHAVIITGPSGTGKTLTADILEFELSQSNPPFEVVDGIKGPNDVRQYFTRSGPVLFHLRDPWGGNRLLPESDRWSNELPKLLKFASEEKKFLITSRTDILRSAGFELSKQLDPYMVPIEIEDYNDQARKQIYDNYCQDLLGTTQEAVRSCRDRVLHVLQRPFEIDRFFAGINNVKNISNELSTLITNSQIHAISNVVTQQVSGNDDSLVSAAVVWGLLSARPAIGDDVIPRLRRQFQRLEPGFRPGVEALVDFLVEGKNLRLERNVLSFFHPKVEDGLRAAIEKKPADTEHALSLLCNALISFGDSDDWGEETALNVLKASTKLNNIIPSLSSGSDAALDVYLEKCALECSPGSFERFFEDLGRWGSEGSLSGELARNLSSKTSDSMMGHFFSWDDPKLSSAAIEILKTHPQTPALMHRFICEVLPLTDTFYGQGIVGFVRSLHEESEASFLQAVSGISNDPTHAMNIEHVVAGALAGSNPPYDQVLAHFFGLLEEANSWWGEYKGEYRLAEEYEVDAQYADHIFEEPGEHFHLPNEGLDAVVNIRRDREGSSWISAYPANDDLMKCWARVASKEDSEVGFTELTEIMDLAERDWTRGKLWSIASKHWSTELTGRLHRELARTDILDDNLNDALLHALAATKPDESWLDDLIKLSKSIPTERNLGLVYDLATTRLDGDKGKVICFSRAQKFAANLDGFTGVVGLALVDILEEKPLDDIGNALAFDAIAFLNDTLPRLSPRIAGPLNCLCAVVGIDPLETARRLLALDESQAGRNALQALAIAGTTECCGEIRKALKHTRYDVRRDAMRRLVLEISECEREVLVSMAQDPSANVRLEFTKMMQDERWPEAIDSLIALLSDTRDFSTDPGHLNQGSWPDYIVAREAASALKRYSQLESHHIVSMVELVTDGSIKDPFVTCGILESLSNKDDTRIDSFLANRLMSPGLNNSIRYNPLAQAAAWAIFDRAFDGMLSVTSGITSLLRTVILEKNEVIVGPIIAAIGFHGDEDLIRTVASVISDHPKAVLGELLLVTTFCSDTEDDMKLVETLNLTDKPVSRLIEILSSHAGENDEIAEAIRNDEVVSSWSQTLDPKNYYEGLLAWLLNKLFELPVSDPDNNPRTYKLPNRIPVMTLRSLSPMREEK